MSSTQSLHLKISWNENFIKDSKGIVKDWTHILKKNKMHLNILVLCIKLYTTLVKGSSVNSSFILSEELEGNFSKS